MKTIFRIIFGLACIIIGVLSIFLRQCNPQQPDIDIIKDTIKIQKYDYVPVPIAYLSHAKTSKPIPIGKLSNDTIRDTTYITDTIWAYNDYLSTRVYLDTLLNNDSGFVSILDTVTLNKIVSRSYDINLINTTKIIQDNKAHFYLGIGSQINDNISLSVNGYFQKKNYLIGLGYNTNKQIMLNYSYKIK